MLTGVPFFPGLPSRPGAPFAPGGPGCSCGKIAALAFVGLGSCVNCSSTRRTYRHLLRRRWLLCCCCWSCCRRRRCGGSIRDGGKDLWRQGNVAPIPKQVVLEPKVSIFEGLQSWVSITRINSLCQALTNASSIFSRQAREEFSFSSLFRQILQNGKRVMSIWRSKTRRYSYRDPFGRHRQLGPQSFPSFLAGEGI